MYSPWLSRNLANAIFQKIPEIFGLCYFLANSFTTAIFGLISGQKIATVKELAKKLHKPNSSGEGIYQEITLAKCL